ncbi:hypothetical protein V3C99_014040 [Haemonchus contortus]
MSSSLSFVILLCCLTAIVLPSRRCGVVLVHKLGKMCKITTEEKCSTLSYDDVHIPLMDVAHRCCSEKCSIAFMQSVCCALNFGRSYQQKLTFNSKDIYETQ